jgi:hypothetical protein
MRDDVVVEHNSSASGGVRTGSVRGGARDGYPNPDLVSVGTYDDAFDVTTLSI